MSNQIFNIPNMAYWLILAVVIAGEAWVFEILWARREAARWTMGYFTVFFLSVPLVAAGYWDTNTWIGLFFGVGVSGAIKVGLAIRKSHTAQGLRKKEAWDGLSVLWQGKGQEDDGPTEWER